MRASALIWLKQHYRRCAVPGGDDKTDYQCTSAKTKIHYTYRIPAVPKHSHPKLETWLSLAYVPGDPSGLRPGLAPFGGGNPTLPLREGPHHQTQVISLDTLPLPRGIDKCGPFKTEHV
jgi:hypothetical protein